MLKKIIALAIAAGFASASFAQGSAPATPSVKPASAVTAKAVESGKSEAKPVVKAEKSKLAVKHGKRHAHAHDKPAKPAEAKPVTPAAK